jgi:hypothetical protein
MTELEYFITLVDWLARKGKLTEQDIAAFAAHLEDEKRLQEAKDFIAENFKGMF